MRIIYNVNQTRCKKPEIEGWAGGLCIFPLPSAESCMCHEDRWFILSLYDSACMGKAGLPQGLAHAVRNYHGKRPRMGVSQRLVGEDFYLFFSSPTTQVCLMSGYNLSLLIL